MPDIILATKTLEAIARGLEKDQGATYRRLLRGLMPLAEDAYSDKEESFRGHLGASLIGRSCARELWFSFRWFVKPKFIGRILRLFNRGHLEEPRLVALLLMIGCVVWQVDDNGKQYRIKGYKGHAGGSLDGVVRGLLEVEGAALTEFKTHNDKSFKKVVKEGVRKSKPEHFVQMQIYMGKYGLSWGLYMAANKNDDDLHAELIKFDPNTFDHYDLRFGLIIDSKDPPARISTTPGWYECKFCDYSGVCHGNDQPERNCRTCRWSVPVENAEWNCTSPAMIAEAESQGGGGDIVLKKEFQLSGCKHYELHPKINYAA